MAGDESRQRLLRDSADAEDPTASACESFHEHQAHHFHPKTVTRIVTRIQALTLELIPIEVDLGALNIRRRQLREVVKLITRMCRRDPLADFFNHHQGCHRGLQPDRGRLCARRPVRLARGAQVLCPPSRKQPGRL